MPEPKGSHAMTLEEFAGLRGDQVPPDTGRLTVVTPALCTALNELLDVMEQEAASATGPMLEALQAIEALMPNHGRLAGGKP